VLTSALVATGKTSAVLKHLAKRASFKWIFFEPKIIVSGLDLLELFENISGVMFLNILYLGKP